MTAITFLSVFTYFTHKSDIKNGFLILRTQGVSLQVFERPYRYFSIAFKVDFFLSDR